MRNISVMILSFFYFSSAFSESVFITNNSASAGKIIIDGRDMSDSGSSIRGSGVKETVSRKVSNFASISSRGGFDINYKRGNLGVSITGDSNLVNEVITEVDGDTLQLSMNKSYSSQLPIVINISSPEIKSLTINGSSDVRLDSIDTAHLKIDLIGAVDLHANGHVSILDIDIKGAGDANLKPLIAETATVDLRGSGDVKLTATKELNAKISGAGDIVFFGNPLKVNKQISGAGDIESGD